jgi:hypothetical protein
LRTIIPPSCARITHSDAAKSLHTPHAARNAAKAMGNPVEAWPSQRSTTPAQSTPAVDPGTGAQLGALPSDLDELVSDAVTFGHPGLIAAAEAAIGRLDDRTRAGDLRRRLDRGALLRALERAEARQARPPRPSMLALADRLEARDRGNGSGTRHQTKHYAGLHDTR